MDHLHSEMRIEAGEVVHVTLSGQTANVLLLDDDEYRRYLAAETFEHRAGGRYTESPAIVRPPEPGRWHLVVDLGGEAGEVRASVSVRPE